MTVDGSQERKVIEVDGFASHGTPRWSHDGQRLAFDAHRANGEHRCFIVSLDGSGLKEMGDYCMPDWSPDDKQLVTQYDGEDRERGVWIENVDGQGAERLTDGGSPRWSPDGTTIAFTDGQSLRVYDTISGEDRRLVDESYADRPAGFDWSHDGKFIAIITTRKSAAGRAS